MAIVFANQIVTAVSHGIFADDSGPLPAENQVQTAVDFGFNDEYTGSYGGGAGTPPAVPTVTIVLSDNDVTATITGDADVTNHLLYRRSSDSSWQSAGTRNGDGDITLSDIDYDIPYIFIVRAVDGSDLVNYSQAYIVTATATLDNDFDSSLATDADLFTDVFAVTVIYKPRGGGTRSINAILDYAQPETLEGVAYGKSPVLIIDVENDSTTGISSSEIDRGGDQLTAPKNINESTMRDWEIRKILSQDHGRMRLECR